MRIMAASASTAHGTKISFLSNLNRVTKYGLLSMSKSSGGCHPRAGERLAA